MRFNWRDLLKKHFLNTPRNSKTHEFFNGFIFQKSDYTKNCFEHKSVIFSQILLKLMAFFWKQTASNFSHVAYKLQWAKWINRSWDGSRLHSATEIKLRNLEPKKAAYSSEIEKGVLFSKKTQLRPMKQSSSSFLNKTEMKDTEFEKYFKHGVQIYFGMIRINEFFFPFWFLRRIY